MRHLRPSHWTNWAMSVVAFLSLGVSVLLLRGQSFFVSVNRLSSSSPSHSNSRSRAIVAMTGSPFGHASKLASAKLLRRSPPLHLFLQEGHVAIGDEKPLGQPVLDFDHPGPVRRPGLTSASPASPSGRGARAAATSGACSSGPSSRRLSASPAGRLSRRPSWRPLWLWLFC